MEFEDNSELETGTSISLFMFHYFVCMTFIYEIPYCLIAHFTF